MTCQDRYTLFKTSSEENRRLLLQEELILEVTEALARALEEQGLQKQELAKRLGKTKGYVTQLLSGGKNLTLRTLAAVADALGRSVQLKLVDSRAEPPLKRKTFYESVRVDDWSQAGSFNVPACLYAQDGVLRTAWVAQ